LIFGSLCLLLMIGIPISFALASVATVGLLFVVGEKGLYLIYNTAYAETSNFLLLAIPLFILMANFLKHSGIGDNLYGVVFKWMGPLPGGLAVGTIIICALFAAMAGISSVATISMGLIALPSMLKRGYDKRLVIGTISAGGALGILIPPSIIMILYGAVADVSIGGLFIGGILPGLVLSIMYIIYILIVAFLNRELAPPIGERYGLVEKLKSLKGVALPLLLVLLVLGVIYGGICTPTEASAVGAFGALICSLIHRQMNWQRLKEVLLDTIRLNAMIFWLIIGAISFSHLLVYAEIQKLIEDGMLGLNLSPFMILVLIQAIFFVLGMFLDPAGIIMITTPIFVPVIKKLGFDPLWFGILFVVNMEMAYLTPPFGFNLFIMRSIVPPGIYMSDIYRSIVPFVAVQALCLILLMIFPEIVMYLPSKMLK
ncbi:MAG: TRAP transporter large permease subunit, partial [Desulfatiglandales bacterium]